jgi:hypothetical protein
VPGCSRPAERSAGRWRLANPTSRNAAMAPRISAACVAAPPWCWLPTLEAARRLMAGTYSSLSVRLKHTLNIVRLPWESVDDLENAGQPTTVQPTLRSAVRQRNRGQSLRHAPSAAVLYSAAMRALHCRYDRGHASSGRVERSPRKHCASSCSGTRLAVSCRRRTGLVTIELQEGCQRPRLACSEPGLTSRRTSPIREVDAALGASGNETTRSGYSRHAQSQAT